MLRLVVLISGNGGNLQAILENIQRGFLQAEVAAVISNNPDAFGLERARSFGVPAIVCDHKAFANRRDFEIALEKHINHYAPDYIVLAGFMRILSADFIATYPHRILNIHPALLPRHKGLHTHRQVLASGDSQHGATVHVVTPELDAGQLLAHSTLPVLDSDTESSLQARVFQLEHRLYSQVLAWLSEGRLHYDEHTDAFLFDQQTLPPQGRLV